MIETIETGSPKVLGLKLCGKLHDEDYKQFVPKWETTLTERRKVRLTKETICNRQFKGRSSAASPWTARSMTMTS